jgi:hypothetical protein
VRLVGGFLGFEIGSQDVDVALLHIEVGGAHSKRFPGLQSVKRQASDCGDELLAAVGLIEAVHPTFADRLANELQGAATTLVGGQPIERLSWFSVLSTHGPTPSGPGVAYNTPPGVRNVQSIDPAS